MWYRAPVGNLSWVSREAAAGKVREFLAAGVAERTIGDDAPCVLLSGGVDSSFVTAELAKQLGTVVAYTAVMDKRSPDLKAARQCAGALGVELREVAIPEPTAQDLEETVERIEMPHKAQVEIAWACVNLAAAIRADGFKVVLSGEGSDELWGSYGFAYHALKSKGWREYRQELFVGQHRKNFARCNKVFMAKSVECRLPFLSTPLVEYALSLPRETVCDKQTTGKELMNEAARGVVPDFVRGRSKLAFQDGAGLKDACAKVVADPKRFYKIAFDKACHGVVA
jgi:asparagine synthase (glutamine-hydrolysing)